MAEQRTPAPPDSATAANRSSAADTAVRAQALAPDASFIVQAPAGSGKTELLIQRLLVLLARAEEPEQVLAITFTRKAAAEMRARLLEALAGAAAEGTPPPAASAEGGHQAATRARARAVLARDAERGWNLRETPARLRIQTFDALCAALVRAQPMRSGLGEVPDVVEDARPLYAAAARATLAALEADGPRAEAVGTLLLHLDGDHVRAEALLSDMLARRDQWLRHLGDAPADSAALRAGLEVELRAAVERALAETAHALRATARRQGVALDAALPPVLHHAALHAAAADPGSPIAWLAGLHGVPPARPDALPQWQGIAELLTTAPHSSLPGAWRKRLDKRQGFPTDKDAGTPAALKAAKAGAQALLTALSAEAETGARLAAVRTLPSGAYSEAQWAVLAALLTLLPGAVAHLREAFAAAAQADFAEVALAAVRALDATHGATHSASNGAGGQRADDAWHILVDEFQDTSHAQWQLLERLTAGWPTDGSHTLFLVGDPMQSIYRFREAEVGLFLRARRQGLGTLRLTPLSLGVNFRSRAALVEWVNAVFPAVLAATESIETGAVPFAPATAHHAGSAGAAVTAHPRVQDDAHTRVDIEAREAARVVALVQAARQERPEGTVAVLVRSRARLAAILPALQAAGLPVQAVEIQALVERPEVQDLRMLTRALAHPADRVAWLAVLRAPWCGLSLSELLQVADAADGGAQDPAGGARPGTVWQALNDAALRRALPADARARVERVVAALAPALHQRGRRSLRRWVEGAWLALGGPACIAAPALANVDAYLARLETLPAGEPERLAAGPEAFAALLERLFAVPAAGADERLQAMTIHKAKGLEFDTVILPGLGRLSRNDNAPLLRWLERAETAPGGAGLLLAPIHETGPQRDAVYEHLASIERERERHETDRLLYVAVTRARHTVHLLGHAVRKDGELRPPSPRSLLARLWPAVAPEFEAAAQATEAQALTSAGDLDEGAGDLPAPYLRRLAAGWHAPATPAGLPLPAAQPQEPEEAVEFKWAGESARHVGTVVHRLLRLLARQGAAGLARWEARSGAFAARAIEAALAGLGVPAAERAAAQARVQQALANTLADPRGRWVLGDHAQARSEYALTALEPGRDGLPGRPVRSVIDRTFVDEAGVRWIVDFKTGVHAGGDREAFLAREQERYRDQLERYARVLGRLEPGRPTRLALYFPLLQAWRDWPALP